VARVVSVGVGFPAATPALVEVGPHPELASPSNRTDAERIKVRRRRVMPRRWHRSTSILATPEARYRHANIDHVTLPAIAGSDGRKLMSLDAAAIRDTERERLRSLVHADMEAAGALHAEDYQLITPRGYAMSKQEYLGRIASGGLRYRVFEPVSDMAVRGSADVALVRYQARISVAEDDGAESLITCWHTDCYEWQDERWQAVWSQATAIRPE
jgi:hypothetical protein